MKLWVAGAPVRHGHEVLSIHSCARQLSVDKLPVDKWTSAGRPCIKSISTTVIRIADFFFQHRLRPTDNTTPWTATACPRQRRTAGTGHLPLHRVPCQPAWWATMTQDATMRARWSTVIAGWRRATRNDIADNILSYRRTTSTTTVNEYKSPWQLRHTDNSVQLATSLTDMRDVLGL